MKPTRENFEVWCIDYLDGNLSNDDIADFMLFLAENPDLSDEFDDMRGLNSPVNASASEINFTHLKKGFSEEQLNEETFEEFCIAFYEGDLDDSETKRLNAYISAHPEKKSRFDAYKKVKLKADLKITYPDKKLLKKPTRLHANRIYKFVLPIAATAAVIAILISTIDLSGKKMVDELHASAKSIETQQIHKELIPNVRVASNTGEANQVVAALPAQTIIKTPEINGDENAIAVFDTSTDRPDIFISSIQFKDQNILIASQAEQKIVMPTTALHGSSGSRLEEFVEIASIRSHQIKNLLFDPSLDRMLQRSVEGFNQIAETDLKYHSDTDENGRLLAFALTSERFNFKRKMRSN